MVSVNDDEVCPYCRDSGKCNRLVIVQSTWKSAIVLCSDPSCIYPLDKSLHSVDRDWSQLGRERKDDDKDILAKAVGDMKLEGEKKFNTDSTQQKNAAVAIDLPHAIAETDQEATLESAELNSKAPASIADDAELNELLDYLSNLPNNAFMSFSELPTSNALNVLNQQNEILKVITLPAIILPDDGLPRMSNVLDHKDSLSEYFQQSNNLGSSLGKLGPRRYPQWSEEKENDLSWLTAGIALVIHSRLIRSILKSSMQALPSGFPEDVSNKDCISALFTVYEMAMRKFLVGVSLCNKESNDIGASQSSGDSASGYETLSGNSNVISYGASPNGFRIPRPIHQRIICHLNSCRDLVRQTMITNKALANHPADVLAFLLSSNDNLKELSVVSYRTTVDCTECGQRSVSFQAARAVTLELPPSLSNFAMIGPQCCASMSCGLCDVPNQMALVEWQTLSPLLFLHFPVGMPENCNFEKLSLELDGVNVSKELIVGLERYGITSRGKYELRVTAVVAVDCRQDVSKGTQYVTWVRRSNDFWMACREAHGPGSHVTEWDPLTAPRTTAVRRCDVRILLFEAQPCPLNNNNNSSSNGGMHKSASAGFLDLQRPPCLLQQRYLSIMRQRRKELHAAAAASSSGPGVSVESAPPNKKNMIQRFLFSEQEHKALLEATRTRFEPYSAEVKVKSPPSSSKSEPTSHSNSAVKSEIFPDNSTRKAKLGTRSVGKGRKKLSVEMSALSLWPTQKRPRLSNAKTEEKVGNAEETSSSQKAFPPVLPDATNADTLFEGLSAKDPEVSR